MDKLKRFKKHCLRYQKVFRLYEWDLFIEYSDNEKTQLGSMNSNWNSSSARVMLNKNYPHTEATLKRTAKHEMIHLLLERLDSLARQRFCNDESIESANEHLVNRLMNLITG